MTFTPAHLKMRVKPSLRARIARVCKDCTPAP
jgi:hypothetical protein